MDKQFEKVIETIKTMQVSFRVSDLNLIISPDGIFDISDGEERYLAEFNENEIRLIVNTFDYLYF
jgi:hypothetical protein